MTAVNDSCSRIADTGKVSFIDAGFNISDLGPKSTPNSAPWNLLVQENRFTIGFLGRAKYKEMTVQQKQVELDPVSPQPVYFLS